MNIHEPLLIVKPPDHVTRAVITNDLIPEGMEGNHQSTVDLRDADAREFHGKLIHQAAIYFNTSLLVDLLRGRSYAGIEWRGEGVLKSRFA